jgi:predicted nuclease of predicted toxin-antitoxin system
MKFVVDMNLSPAWVEVLRDAGFEAVHWRDVGPRDAPDSVVLAWAKQHLHVLLTHDLDFGAILAASRAEGPSVLQLRIDDPLPDVHAGTMLNAIRDFESQLVDGALISVEPGRARARVLPLEE